ncbi:MAG: MinD/ParA family protein [bacterium]|nr:MinD/ParA family protein [bacterium]
MLDQAARLREIATEFNDKPDVPLNKSYRSVKKAEVIAVSSGKGGVGKTNIAVNTALKLRESNKSVLIMDADYNLANADLIMGISPNFTLADAIIKNYSIKEVVHEGPEKIHILPGGSGFNDLTDIPSEKRQRIFKQLADLEKNYDYIIIDTPAGLNRHVLDILTFSSRILMVITPEPTSIADTYAVLKVLSMQREGMKANIVVNQVKSFDQAKEIYIKFKLVIDKFLKIAVKFTGYILSDDRIRQSVMKQKPFVLEFPRCSASKCLDNLVDQLITKENLPIAQIEESFFHKLAKISLFN